jgi:deazaflavin-dependent oxidoreductase (nitroreductase family)
MSRGASGRPEASLLRALRAPLWVYHRDLGPLLGSRFVYLAHQGRLTGLRRETVLRVARLDHEAGEIVVIAAWGNRAHWVRNLRAGRALELRIGHLRFPEPEHRFLPDEETRSLLVSCREDRPVRYRLTTGVLPLPADPKNDDLGGVRAVAFRPHVPPAAD